jgi:cholesterol oxidase
MTVTEPIAGFDVVVVGSGFGGSVAALRLTEKGYRVAVVEAGRRFADDEFPETSWRLRRFLWAPRLGCYGIQRITLLRNVLVLSGAGVGGGSLVYANTLYRPPERFFADPQWAGITDWSAELAPHYDQAERMLGVVPYVGETPSDRAMRTVAGQMGVGDTFHNAPVGVFLGTPGEAVDDPYFGGVGPARNGCLQCGECMTGCRHNAKNTLVKNYLYLAEKAGARVFPRSTVTAVRPQAGGGYRVEMTRTGSVGTSGNRRAFAADQVVFAAGALGTQRLLHEMRDTGVLPGLSPALGTLTRTNSESIVGAKSNRSDVDFTRGVAITSSFHPDPDTHIEPVRYGHGSNAMGLLQTLLTDGGGRLPRSLKWLAEAARHPGALARGISTRRWSERTIIALVMQSLDNSLTVRRRRGPFGGLTSSQGHGEPNPGWIPAGNEAVRRLAELIDGTPGGSWGEIFNIPLTAHILGGCPIGADPEHGVVDAYQRVYGHPGLHVLDGAAVSANLGVNPSLTITAQAERAVSLWPNRGADDPRPPLGADYRRVEPVPPADPVVPPSAPAALRLRPLR